MPIIIIRSSGWITFLGLDYRTPFHARLKPLFCLNISAGHHCRHVSHTIDGLKEYASHWFLHRAIVTRSPLRRHIRHWFSRVIRHYYQSWLIRPFLGMDYRHHCHIEVSPQVGVTLPIQPLLYWIGGAILGWLGIAINNIRFIIISYATAHYAGHTFTPLHAMAINIAVISFHCQLFHIGHYYIISLINNTTISLLVIFRHTYTLHCIAIVTPLLLLILLLSYFFITHYNTLILFSSPLPALYYMPLLLSLFTYRHYYYWYVIVVFAIITIIIIIVIITLLSFHYYYYWLSCHIIFASHWLLRHIVIVIFIINTVYTLRHYNITLLLAYQLSCHCICFHDIITLSLFSLNILLLYAIHIIINMLSLLSH